MGLILKTATLALLLMGGDDLEKRTQPASDTKYITIQGKTYRQRPPGAYCDPALYGTPVKEEPQKTPPLGPLYFGIGLAAVIGTAIFMRKKHDTVIENAVIENNKSERSWDFFGIYARPVVDYKIDRQDREL